MPEIPGPPEGLDLLDPGLFARDAFWPVFAWLRRNAPVHRHPEPDGPGFWVVSRYRDIAAVYADAETFSSRYGMRLDSDPGAVEAVAQRMLIVSDAPDHTRLKRVLQRSFGPSAMPRMEELVRGVVAEVVGEAAETGEVDFIDVAKKIPNHVVCALMGIPREDREWIGGITTDAFESEDEAERSGAHGEIFLYFADLLHERRARPGDDFVSAIATERRAADVPGGERPLTDEEIIFNCNGVLAGANETTRYSAAGGVLALARDPGQWELLRAAGPAGASAAAEEILRWTTPGVHALRTVMRPAQVGGVRVEPGDRVTLWNVSANRDEEVFDRPGRFLADRTPNRHIAFGHGPHLCLGARLARLELSAFVAELTRRVERIELTGDPVYNASNFTWGLRRLPVRLAPARVPAPA
ncbi:cytochrome P450 [Planomonospora sp. ID91781]|uniref:Cytochrome P450 n=1 Tax=Planomonospora sphaerica TaxID=161355 RepID=A0A161MEV4_9ACTN|nr:MULTISPECIES: cytochrome P450 [Planomonospora]MBG0822774.1 cytochrome P450 [Planomonospora sp. ID91781]GAT70663.1 cytochrome P450 [Planomonospora sphaerica]